MKQLHQHLENNIAWYKRWHETGHHKTVHYGVLFLAIAFAMALIMSSNPVKAVNSTYYISPTGSDTASGTITAPWKTFQKLQTAGINPGDTIYVRGGTYTSNAGNNADVHFQIGPLNGTQAQPINILAYPGEKPIFNLSNVLPNPGKYVTGMWLYGSNWVNLKGFTIKNLAQDPTGGAVNRGFQIVQSNNCRVELLDVYNIGGTGIAVDHSNNNLIINNDSHNNGDGMSPDHWNFGDGFTIGTGGDTSNNNVFEGNRAWMNGDDGWDGFEWSGQKVTYKNNWSFWNSVKPWGINGTQPPVNDSGMTPYTPSLWKNTTTGMFTPAADGTYPYLTSTESGEGFKLGGCNYPQPQSNCPPGAPTVLKKYLENNVSFGNVGTGYAANMAAEWSHRMSIINSLAFNNGNDGLGFGTGRSVGIAMIFKNDWAWNNNRLQSGGNVVYDGVVGTGSYTANNCPSSVGNNCPNISNNYWGSWYNGGSGYSNPGNLNSAYGGTIPQLTTGNFLSIDESLGVTPRQADGSLPNVNFLKLATGSGLIDKGVPVINSAGSQIVFNGSAPDLGPYESGTTDPNPPTVTLTAPTGGQTLGGNILMNATATDNVGVIKVEFYKGSSLLGLDTTSPYSYLWDSTSSTNGSTALSAKAYDATGNVGTSPVVNMTVQNIVTTITPDLKLNLSPNPVILRTQGTTADLAISVQEIAGGATTAPIEVRVTKNSGFSASLVSSPNWNLDSSNSGWYTLTSSSTIPANGTSLITLRYTKNTASYGTAPITVRIRMPSGGQTNTSNDLASTTLDYTSGIVVNDTPTADAGSNQTITLPTNLVTLAGSGTDVDGTIASYAWTKVSGSGTITSPSSATTTVTGLVQGTSIFKLTVTDNQGGTGSANVSVTVNVAVGGASFTFSPTFPSVNGSTTSSTSVSGSNSVEITVTGTNTITKVEFYCDGVLIGTDTTSNPFSIAAGWQTTTVSNGVHLITAKAYDNLGNTAMSTPVSVTVAN